MRISRYVVVDQFPDAEDLAFMAQVAVTAATEAPEGLPGHMVDAMRESAAMYLHDGYVSDYHFICLIAVQARPGGEPEETIWLRKELESIFMTLLFG